MQPLKFKRDIESVFAHAENDGLSIDCGWTVLVRRADAVEYVQTYGSEPNVGFYEHEGKVIFTHATGRIAFSQEEAAALVELIRAAYPEASSKS